MPIATRNAPGRNNCRRFRHASLSRRSLRVQAALFFRLATRSCRSPLFLVAGVFLLCGCRSRLSESNSPNERWAKIISRRVAEEKRTEALARFATGISYEINNRPEIALEQFQLSAAADPANETLALELAQRFVEGREFDQAIQILTKTAQQPEASGEIFSALARLYLSRGQTNLALSAGQSAIKKSPASISGYELLLEIFLQTGQRDEGRKILERGDKQTEADALFLLNLSELYRRLARADAKDSETLNQKELDLLQRAAAQNTDNPNVRLKLADRLGPLGDWKKAAEIYLGLLNEYGDTPLMRDTLREKLTNLYLKNKDRDKATEQLEAVVRDSPTRYPEAWHYLANFAADAKNYAKAADYFGRAILLNPAMEQAYYDFAAMHISNEQPGEALKILDQARAKFPHSFGGEFFTALAFSRQKNFAEAIKHFTTAEVIAKATDPARLNHLFYFQMGAAYERNREYAQAESYFEKCLRLSPDFPDALNYLGFMWADRGEKLERARELIEKALKLEPDNDAYLDSLGWVLFKLKEYEPALRHLLRAVALSEKPDATVFDHLGDVYHALQQPDKAREAWEKSLSLEPTETVQKKIQSNPAP